MRTKGKKNVSKQISSIILLLLSVVVLAGLSYWGIYGGRIGNYKLNSFGETIKRGLDLQGGVSVLMEIQEDKVDVDTLNRTKQLLSLRVNKVGVGETTVSAEGDKRIRIDIPGQSDSKSIVDTLTATGELKFVGPDKQTELLTGQDVKEATSYYDSNGKPMVGLKFTDDGTKKFAEATQKYLNQIIYIYMDDQIISQPNVGVVITDGQAVIEGSKDLDEAKKTANIIQSGALPVKVKVATVKTVGPTLGQEALDKSLTAAMVGIGLVFVFMIVLYRLPGVMASLALVLYIFLVLLTFESIGVVLTLPGIAAFLLTVGMAVDANVLIFERTRDELKLGKSIKTSIQSGFSRAMSSILDANTTTIIAALTLYFLGSGSVKGFAITLMIGTIISMFSAIIVTKFFINLAFNAGILNKHGAFRVKRG
jgi:preprotein translocase subunit SecD